MYNFGLVLEGGGMRGLYSAGVLDFLIDEGIEFNAVYGVSAGSANGCNFISRQRKRTYHIYTDFIDDKRYASFDNLIRTGNFFGTEMNYDEIPNKLIPYDYDKFLEYKGDFYVVVTNCETGHPMYKKITDLKKELYILRASCSLPLMAASTSPASKRYSISFLRSILSIGTTTFPLMMTARKDTIHS